MQFRVKLMFSYLLLIVLVSGSIYLYIDHILEKNLVRESRASLVSETRLARMLISTGNMAAPQQLAETIGSAIRARVTIIARDGLVIGDSEVGGPGLAGMENHLDRPEVQEALRTGTGTSMRYSETLRMEMLYVAMTYGNGHADGFVRLAMPLSYIASARSALHGLLGGATGLTVLAALLLSYLLSNLTTRPLRDMAAA
ncbi:MAG TPA: PAS domain-containing sensor histidine kinase, partial [Desulfuromonadaceae bacterium]